jgi:hypothetical protein
MKRAVALMIVLGHLSLGQIGASVEGVVTNAVTHSPIVGVSVVLSTKGEQYDATTDSSGAYRINSPTPGSYGARFYKQGFLDTERGNNVYGPPILVGGGPLRLDAQLMPLASISGRVLDPDGKPLPNSQSKPNSSILWKPTATGTSPWIICAPDRTPWWPSQNSP